MTTRQIVDGKDRVISESGITTIVKGKGNIARPSPLVGGQDIGHLV